ncbi:MAG: glutathione S-transferase N-terminal domain-containing protein, partial [Betaproteobacteria bacterium]
MLKILGRSSSINVRKVLWLCAELDLPFEQENWGAGFRSTAEPEFLALNPGGLIPVVCDDDFVLWESNAICRYLAAKQGRNDLLPDDLENKARVEQWMDWMST